MAGLFDDIVSAPVKGGSSQTGSAPLFIDIVDGPEPAAQQSSFNDANTSLEQNPGKRLFTPANQGNEQNVTGISTSNSASDIARTRTEYVDKPAQSIKAGLGQVASTAAFPVASIADTIQGGDYNKEALANSIQDFTQQKRDAAPDASVGFAGKMVRSLEELAPLIATGPAAVPLIAGEATASKGIDLADQGVTGPTNSFLSVLSGAVAYGFTKLPFTGSSTASSVVRGTTMNPVLGGMQRLAEKQVLEANDYDTIADSIKVIDPEAAPQEIAMGMLFGYLGGKGKPAYGASAAENFVPFWDTVKGSNWYREKTIPERGLVAQDVKTVYDSLLSNGHSEADIAKMGTAFFQEALKRRNGTEVQPTEPIESAPVISAPPAPVNAAEDVIIPHTGINDPSVSVDDAIFAANAEVQSAVGGASIKDRIDAAALRSMPTQVDDSIASSESVMRDLGMWREPVIEPAVSAQPIERVIAKETSNPDSIGGDIAQGRQESADLQAEADAVIPVPDTQQIDPNGSGPSPVTKVDDPAQSLPAPGAFSRTDAKAETSPAAKIETTLPPVQQEFIRNRVKALGSIEAVQAKYPDQAAPVDRYARDFADQLFTPFPHQADVQAASLAKTLEQAGIGDKHPAHAVVLDERRQRERTPDPQTGFITKEHFEPTMDRAWTEHGKGRDFSYAEIDLRNLGGMNAKLGTSSADVHMKTIAKIIGDEIKVGIPGAQVFRKGGDEFGVVAPDASADTVNKVLAKASDRVKLYGEENGLDTIPHVKGKSTPGVGIQYGTADFKDHSSLADVRRTADIAVEEAKNVNVSKATETGAVTPREQAGGTEQSAGVDVARSRIKASAKPQGSATEEVTTPPTPARLVTAPAQTDASEAPLSTTAQKPASAGTDATRTILQRLQNPKRLKYRMVQGLAIDHGKGVVNTLVRQGLVRFPGKGIAEITKAGESWLKANPAPRTAIQQTRMEFLQRKKKLSDKESATLDSLRAMGAPGSDSTSARFSVAKNGDGYSILKDPAPSEAQEVQTGTEGKTAVAAAKFIAKNAPDESHRFIAEKVADRIKDLESIGSVFTLNVSHVGGEIPDTMLQSGVRGQVFQRAGEAETHIWLNGADVTGSVGVSYETVLHELIHAATQKAIDLGEHGAGGELGQVVGDLHNSVYSVYNLIRSKLSSGEGLNQFEEDFNKFRNNTLSSAHEFVAYALSNKEMQGYLESIPYRGTTAWGKFSETIRKFLGLSPREETVLSGVLNVSDKLLSVDANHLLLESILQNVRMSVNRVRSGPDGAGRGIYNTSRTQPAVYDQSALTPEAIARVKLLISRALPGESVDFNVAPTIDYNGPGMADAYAQHGVTSGKIQGLQVSKRDITTGEVRSIITLALDGATDKTGYHETFHAAEALGIISQKDIGILERAYPDKDGVKSGERRADAFADYVENGTKPQGYARILFDRIMAFLRRLKQYAMGRGWRTADDVFGDVESGAAKEREVSAGEAGPQLSATGPRSPFYSKLSEVVNNKMGGKMHVAQLNRMLENNGVTRDEIDNVMGEFVGRESVSKGEMQEAIKANSVPLKDVVLSDRFRVDLTGGQNETFGTKSEAIKRIEEENEWIDDESAQIFGGEDDGYLTVSDHDGNAVYEIEKTDGEWRGKYEYEDWDNSSTFDDFDEAEEVAASAAEKIRDTWRSELSNEPYLVGKGSHHFSQYTEPGAIDGSYREMFVTAPPSESSKISPEIQEKYKGEIAYNKRHLEFMEELGDPDGIRGAKNLIEATNARMVAESKLPTWQDGHSQYSEIQNPVVRIRFNERNADGKRVLFIEEMQGPSDANQQKMPDYLRKRIYDLGVKRILAYAKENGFDGVAWTPGVMQSARYDLSKQIDSVDVIHNNYPGAEGTYDVNAEKNGEMIAYEKEISKERLADFIGKDLAAKAVAEIPPGLSSTYSGLDLKVGGEGLTSLYDRTLPALFKKYGKEGVSNIPLEIPKTSKQSAEAVTTEHRAEIRAIVRENDNLGYDLPGDAVSDLITGRLSADHAEWNSPEDLARVNAILKKQEAASSNTVHFIPITSKTPASYPQFSVSKAKAPNNKTADETAKDLLNAPQPSRMQRLSDYMTIDPVPKLSRLKLGDSGATVADAAVQHASARIAVPHMVDSLLSTVFPDEYKNPATMARTIDILNKDNILSGYDNFVERAQKAYEDGDEDLASKWMSMADDVAEKHDLSEYDQEVRDAKYDPEISGNIERWKKTVNPLLDSLYNEVKRVDPETERDTRGRHFGARVNLLPGNKAEQWQEFNKDAQSPMPEPSVSNYRNPNVKRDQTDQMAKFTGEYSDDARLVLTSVLSHRWNEATKLRLYSDLIKSGAAIEADGVERPAEIQGHPASWFDYDVPKTTKDGRPMRGKVGLWVRRDIVPEVRAVLNTDQQTNQNPVLAALTQIQLMQIADAITHSKNIMTVITRAQGTGSAWKDVVRKMPILGTADAIVRIANVAHEVAANGPEIQREIAKMSADGLVRPTFPNLGIQKITHAQEILHHADTAARVIMYRFHQDLVDRGLAKDTPESRRNYINQVGQYNRRLMGSIMKSFRDMGVSPFIVAGRNFNRQGRRWITGDPGVTPTGKAAAWQMRMTNILGTALLFTIPAMLNMITTGQPGGRSGTPLGAWDLGTDNDEKGKHKVIDLLQITGVRRGLRVTGLEAVIEGLRIKESANEITGKALTGSIQSQLHPWMGPGAAMVYKMATGKQPDMRGRMEAQRIPGAGGMQFLENTRAALESQNPFLYAMTNPVFQGIGLDQKMHDTHNLYGPMAGAFLGGAVGAIKGGVKGALAGAAMGAVAGSIAQNGETRDALLKSPASAFGIQDKSTAAIQEMQQIWSERGGVAMTPHEASKSKIKGDLRGKDKSEIQETLQGAVADGTITNYERLKLSKSLSKPQIMAVARFEPDEMLRVMSKATEDEMRVLKPIFTRKIGASKSLTPEDKNIYREKLQEIGQ